MNWFIITHPAKGVGAALLPLPDFLDGSKIAVEYGWKTFSTLPSINLLSYIT